MFNQCAKKLLIIHEYKLEYTPVLQFYSGKTTFNGFKHHFLVINEHFTHHLYEYGNFMGS